jgi:hypothetical protein
VRLDLRLSEAFQIERLRVQLNLDAYNALNANSIRAENSTYGAQWRRPLQILEPGFSRSAGRFPSEALSEPPSRRSTRRRLRVPVSGYSRRLEYPFFWNRVSLASSVPLHP